MKRLAFLFGLLKGQGAWVLAGVALAVTTALANIALMAVSGWFITGMAAAGLAGAGAAGFNYFLPAAVIRGCAMARTAGRYLERLVTHEATFRLIGGLRVRVFLALAPRLPFGLPGAHSGDLAARAGADLDSLQRVYLQVAVPVLTAAIVGAAAVGYAATRDQGVAILLAGGLVLGGVALPGALALAGRRPGRDAVAAASALRTWAVDRAQGLDELEAFGATARHGDGLIREQERLAAAQARSARQEAVGAAVGQSLGSLVLWGVLWGAVVAGAPLVAAGTLAAPDLVMLAFLALASVEVTGPLAGAFQAWGAMAAAADRIRPLLAAPPPPAPLPVPSGSRPPHVRLRSVAVRYPAGDGRALDGLTLDLPPGARVALVGPSGSGKSTVAALLAGFLPVEKGEVLLDGRPVAPGDAGALAGLLAAAPQTPHLLAGSVRRNLQVAAPWADDAALVDACERAALGPWLAGLPEGLDTAIGEGGRPLSGGEARRLAVARALLGSGPILVLDEPGEGLDPATGRRLLDGVLSSPGTRTVLLITHRVTCLERMDHVVMMDRGRVLEQGPPWALAGRDGPFRRFLERSFV